MYFTIVDDLEPDREKLKNIIEKDCTAPAYVEVQEISSQGNPLPSLIALNLLFSQSQQTAVHQAFLDYPFFRTGKGGWS